jgi:surfeit locus 1 family protein
LTRLRLGLFIAVAIVAAAVCIRLGFWQVDRLHQRRARNALVRARLDSAEVDARSVPRDTILARFRRVRVVGVPDFDHEIVLASRSRHGSPGVNIITPYRTTGSDTAILVNRGWVYSPDAASVDLPQWRRADSTVVGFVDEFEPDRGGPLTNRVRVLNRLSASALGTALPYPVAPFVVVETGDTVLRSDRPAQLGPPALDEGPHFSYAVQWFGFALVALVGAVVVVTRGRRVGDPAARPLD